jgi:signal transduction histidine kinase
LEKGVAIEAQAPESHFFDPMASLLDSLDRPLLVADRRGRLLFANVHARECLRARGLNPAGEQNLFRDLLQVGAREIVAQLESGEQEVDLQVKGPQGDARARMRWLPEPDWLVVYIEPVARAGEDGEMRQRVQELLQEREITYRNLLAAYLRLQEVNRQKTLFLASAAHELKTPLAVMKGYNDLLLSGSLGKLAAKQREILEDSKESCARLVRLVSMFLNYSALESGKLVVQMRENDLRDCLTELVGLWHHAFQRKGVRLETDFRGSLPRFKFDYQKVEQCAANLLDNALKHTPGGGRVVLTLEPHFWERRVSEIVPAAERRRHLLAGEPNSARVSVSDTGLGIAAEFHQEIFEDFVRVDRSSSGMGLGLAITKRLIQAHRGKIWVDSDPGSGCNFTFILPLYAV